MKKKIFALLMVCAVVLSAVGVGFADPKDDKKAKTNNQLLALLPPSDVAVALDSKRFFGEALPQILSANQPLLTEITGRFDEIKSRTGIDFKQFQQVAIGVTSFKAVENGYDFEPLVLGRGQLKADGLITIAKTASNGKYREEKIGAKTVYIFSPQEVIEQNKGKIGNSAFGGILSKILVGLTKEMALTTYDDNTLVLGSLARVREMFESKTRISPEVLDLVSRKPNALMNFGALVPNGLSEFMTLEDDDLGNSLRGIRQLFGSVDVLGGNTSLSIVAKTAEAPQAKTLKDTLAGFQGLAGILKASKREDQKIYGRMLENVKIAQNGSEVSIDLQVPQADLNVIVGAKK
jgi:hypothetical protein